MYTYRRSVRPASEALVALGLFIGFASGLALGCVATIDYLERSRIVAPNSCASHDCWE